MQVHGGAQVGDLEDERGRPGRRAWSFRMSRPYLQSVGTIGDRRTRPLTRVPWPVVPAEPTTSGPPPPPGTRSSARPSTASPSTATTAPRSTTSPTGRHPPAQPAAPLPLEGGPLRRGLRAAPDRLGRPGRARSPATPARAGRRSIIVLTAGFRFFEENPELVRLMRREALDGGAHLAASTWRSPCGRCSTQAVGFLEREMAAGDLPAPRPRAAAAHRLRRPAHATSATRPFLGGAARRRPAVAGRCCASASITSSTSSEPALLPQ